MSWLQFLLKLLLCLLRSKGPFRKFICALIDYRSFQKALSFSLRHSAGSQIIRERPGYIGKRGLEPPTARQFMCTLLYQLSYFPTAFLENSPSASSHRIRYSEMLPAAWRPAISHAVSLIQFRPNSVTGKFFPPLLRETTAYRRNLNDTRAIDRSASISIALSIVFGLYSPTGNRYCLWQFKNNISDNPFSDRPQLYGMPRPIRFIGTAKPSAWPDMLFYEFHRFKFLEGKPSKCESENSPCKDQHVLFPWYSNDTSYRTTKPCNKRTDRTCENAFQNSDPDYVRRQCPGIKGAACLNDRLNE